MRRLALVALLASAPAFASTTTTTVLNRRIAPGQTLGSVLYASPLAPEQVAAVLSAFEGVLDFHKVRDNDQLRIVLEDGQVQDVDFRQDELTELQVHRDGDALVGLKRQVEVEKEVARVSLSVESSLYEAAAGAGEDPSIAMALADVFAWDVDFYQDVRKGDQVDALVEKFVSNGRLVRYGEVLAARYQGQAVGDKEVFRYELKEGDFSYFGRDGQSARKSFLKSPLKFAHVTSRYGSRYHPVLHYVKQHRGVDYGTPVGTPVWAVADGTVLKAGNYGPNGNMVCLRHRNGWESCYCHLSKFGAGVRVGARVNQKQVIAYSGNTGRTTGPHVHYALKRNGSFVNPLNQHFPRADPVPAALLADYQAKTAPLAARLSATQVAAASVLPVSAP
jgi:murein DD-endopeptidase MepM/ murein hydrolase activator NlpD